MSAQKHTPGPWRWTTVDYGPRFSDGNYVECGGGGPFDALWSDAIGKAVFVAQDASSYTAHCDFPNDLDASLIAAAPDLLAALKAVVAVADRDTDEFNAARAAIAKATGDA